MNVEFLYLTILDRFTKCDKCTPSRGEICDPVSMRPGIYSVDLFSHFLNSVFHLYITIYERVMSEVAGKCAMAFK